MTEKLEKLIALAVTDGVITERELEILKKKAQEEGVDEDELEMLLDTRLYERKEALKEEIKNSIPPPPSEKPKSNKEGDLKKCPSCGAPVQSFNTKCSDCGHEFRNVESTKSVASFFSEMNLLEANNSSSGGLMSMFGEMTGMSKIDNQKKEMIKNFPIPNSKEDLLEFLSLAVPLSKKSTYLDRLKGNFDPKKDVFASIWFTKCEQIIMKARFSMKEDKATLAQIEHYAKELKIK